MRLKGRTILITRSAEQAPELCGLLEAEGARVLAVPTIKIRPRPEAASQLADLSGYDWLIFTSTNAVDIFLELRSGMGSRGTVIPASDSPRICAVGPATADRLRESDLKVDLVPEIYRAEGVVAAFRDLYPDGLQRLRILFPAASGARRLIPDELSKAKARVDFVPIYDTVAPEDGAGILRAALDQGPDLVVFTSSSTVRNFVSMAGNRVSSGLSCAVIGPVTAATARELGLTVSVIPDESTIPALASAIVQSIANSLPRSGQ